MDKFDFLKEWFYKEEERKDFLNNSINTQLTILTALVGAIYLYSTTFNYESNIYQTIIFIIIIIFTISLWLFSIYNLLMSYNKLNKGYSYKGFPSANFINEEYENLRDYYNNNLLDLDQNLDELVQDNVELILIESLDNNVYLNDLKSSFLHKSKICLSYCIFSLLILTIIFSINYISKNKEEGKSSKVEIYYMSESKPPKKPTPATQPRIIKEDRAPKRRDAPSVKKPCSAPKKLK